MKKSITLFLFLSSLTHVSATWASGLSKPVNIGPKAIGMGGAFMGVADDPTAIYHNPAGMTQMEGHEFFVGMDGLITNLDYTFPAAPTESADTEFLPIPTFAYVANIWKPISVGLGVFFPHGNGGTFSTPSADPLNPNEGRIYSMEIAPAVAWQIIPQLSVGASMRIVRISSALKGQAFPAGVLAPIAVTLDDLEVSGWGFGASAGVLYKPCSFVSFGANYRSKVSATLDGNSTFTPLGSFPASLDQTLPTLVTAGFGIHPMEPLTVGIGYGYERNSEIDAFTGTIGSTPPTPINLPQGWSDSHTFHLGADYRLFPTLALRAGYAKDFNESIPDTVMNRIVGDIAANEVSFGLAYDWQRYSFALSWNARFGERTIPVTASNPAPGEYSAFVQMISLGIGIKI